MPSGITAPIEEGSIVNAQQFLQQCFKGSYRFLWESDAKIGEDWTPIIQDYFMSDVKYHQNRLDHEKKNLQEFEAIAKDENKLYKKYCKLNHSDKEYWEKALAERQANNDTYHIILSQIEHWDCPERFNGLKKMAINQINESMNDTDYCEKQLTGKDDDIRADFHKIKDDFIAKMRKDIQWEIDYHTKEISEVMRNMNRCLDDYEALMKEIKKLN